MRTGSLQSGQVDVIGGVPPQDIDTLRDGDFEIVARPNPGVTFGLSPVQDHAPLDDVRVRQAIAAAIDTTEVRDTVLSDDFAVAKSVLSQTTPGFVDRARADRLRHRRRPPACSTRPAGPRAATASAPRTARSCTSSSAG